MRQRHLPKKGRFITPQDTTRKNGKRKEKYFETLPEAKNWLADARYEERHNLIVTSPDMTVDKWFEYWIENIVCDLAPNTKRNYQERYKWNIQPVIGAMCIADVKPMHCKAVLNRMETTYAGSTIRQAYITMGTMLKSAVMNDIIAKHPMNGVRYTKPVRAADDIKYLTVDEQEKFLEAAARSHNYRQYALLLETGLRTAELIGLTWDSIDWKKRTLTVSKSLEYRHSQGYWRAGPPKTQKSYRTIPLTDKAYSILKSCYDEKDSRKKSETLSQILEYIDSRTGEKKCLIMHDLVFVNWRTGEPAKNSSYDTHLYKLCDEAGIKRFVCTPYDTLMLHARLSAAYSLKCCTAIRTRNIKQHRQICSCYGRVTGKCHTPISTGYAASYKKRA